MLVGCKPQQEWRLPHPGWRRVNVEGAGMLEGLPWAARNPRSCHRRRAGCPDNQLLACPFTTPGRELIRRELGQPFGRLPVIDGLFLRTWRGGLHAGWPKLSPVVRSMADLGLVKVRMGRRWPFLRSCRRLFRNLIAARWHEGILHGCGARHLARACPQPASVRPHALHPRLRGRRRSWVGT